jgi:hypothetical protein
MACCLDGGRLSPPDTSGAVNRQASSPCSQLGLRLDLSRARAAVGFDYFAIGMPGKAAMGDLAAWLSALGE